MDYVKPAEVAKSMVEAGRAKLALPIPSLLVRGILSGAILGVGTTKSVRSVRWIWGQKIVIAWVLTIPCSASRRCTAVCWKYG